MGKSPEGLFGPTSGKVGNHVFYTLRGKTYVRMKPRKRKGKKTLKEKSNTSGFAKVQAFMQPIQLFLKVGFKDYGTLTGGYKGAVSYALKHAIEGEYPDQYVNPELVRVCGGALHFPLTSEIVFEAERMLRFNWSTENEDGSSAYDQVFMLAYAPADVHFPNASYCGVSTGAIRKTGSDSLKLPAGRKDREYHVYMGFIEKDRSCQSHSRYMGKVLVSAV